MIKSGEERVKSLDTLQMILNVQCIINLFIDNTGIKISIFQNITYIFDSDLVWRMQLMIIKGSKFLFCV